MNLGLAFAITFAAILRVVTGQTACDAAGEALVACGLTLNSLNAILCLACIASIEEDPEIDPDVATCSQEGARVCAATRQCSACRGCFSELDDSIFKCAGSDDNGNVINADLFDCVCPDGCRANPGSIFFGKC